MTEKPSEINFQFDKSTKIYEPDDDKNSDIYEYNYKIDNNETIVIYLAFGNPIIQQQESPQDTYFYIYMVKNLPKNTDFNSNIFVSFSKIGLLKITIPPDNPIDLSDENAFNTLLQNPQNIITFFQTPDYIKKYTLSDDNAFRFFLKKYIVNDSNNINQISFPTIDEKISYYLSKVPTLSRKLPEDINKKEKIIDNFYRMLFITCYLNENGDPMTQNGFYYMFNIDNTLPNNLQIKLIDNNIKAWMDLLFSNSKSSNYNVLDIAGNGDCFFTSIIYAFFKYNLKTTVQKLREYVSSSFYNKDDMPTWVADAGEYLKQYNQTNISNILKGQLKKEGNNNINDGNMDLNDKYNFMIFMNTQYYFADEYSIITLEKYLNIKFIIINATQDPNDNKIIIYPNKVDSKEFSPYFYIILYFDMNNKHYDLITYDNNYIFLFDQLPKPIINNIMNKLKKDNQNRSENDRFYFTKDFYDIYNDNKKSGFFSMFKGGSGNDYKENSDNKNTDDDTSINELKDIDKIPVSLLQNLYDDNIVFIIDKNADNNPPGKNVGEKIPDSKINNFKELENIKYSNWRRKLDNSWSNTYEDKYAINKSLFLLDGFNWFSVEHYYQASKFKNEHPDFYKKFSLNSKSELSQNVSMAKCIGNNKKYNNDNCRPANINIDPEFTENKSKILERALFAKFSQNPELGYILLLTQKGKLMLYRKKQNKIADELMIVRDKIDKLTSTNHNSK